MGLMLNRGKAAESLTGETLRYPLFGQGASISGVRGVKNRSWVFSERLGQVSPKGAK